MNRCIAFQQDFANRFSQSRAAGSRHTVTSQSLIRNQSQNNRIYVVLPTPSTPSKLRKRSAAGKRESGMHRSTPPVSTESNEHVMATF